MRALDFIPKRTCESVSTDSRQMLSRPIIAGCWILLKQFAATTNATPAQLALAMAIGS